MTNGFTCKASAAAVALALAALSGAQVESILAVGHADRIGPEQYNEKLSAARAESVKEYLAQKGISPDRVRSEARGESEPVTGDQCKGQKGAKLVSCLQPDRRVDVEVTPCSFDFCTRKALSRRSAPPRRAPRVSPT